MLVVEHYNYLPGCCSFCRSSNLPTIDTGMDLDWENSPFDENPSAMRRLYVCADCAVNMAMMVKEYRNIEFSQAGTNSELQAQLNELAQNNARLMTRLNDLEAALSVIRSISPQTTQVIEQSDNIDVTTFTVAKPKPKGAKS